MMSLFNFQSRVKVFKIYLIFILYMSIVNSEINETENKVLCSKNNVYSCQCNYYTSQTTELPVVDIDCSAIDLLSLNKQIVIPLLAQLLDLSLNDITVITNEETLISSNLKTLILSKNRINRIDKDAFKYLPNITTLDLSDNLITKIHPNTFDSIIKLESLNLAYNQIQIFESHTFKPIQHLKELNLNDNNLGVYFNNLSDIFDVETLCVNPKLAVLKIENNNITELRSTFFKSAHHLKRVSLAGNNFVFLPKLPSTISYLDISSTQISIIGPEDFSNYPVIDVLILNNLENLTHIQKNAFKDLKNLEKLKIENCKRLKKLSPEMLGINEDDGYKDYDFTLKKISVFGSGLKTLGEDWYPIVSRLSYIDLRGNPWRCDCKLSWLLQINIPEKDREFIRCYKPQRLHDKSLWSLNNKEMTCMENLDVMHFLVTNSLILLCVVMICLAIWLVLVWPKTKATTRTVHPSERPYTVISLEPNNSENF